MDMQIKKKPTQFNLHIDQDLKDWVKEQGEKHERPMNYIIVHAIKQLRKQQSI